MIFEGNTQIIRPPQRIARQGLVVGRLKFVGLRPMVLVKIVVPVYFDDTLRTGQSKEVVQPCLRLRNPLHCDKRESPISKRGIRPAEIVGSRRLGTNSGLIRASQMFMLNMGN